MSRPVRVGFVVYGSPTSADGVLVRELIDRLGPAITATVFRIRRTGRQWPATGIDVVDLDGKPGRDFAAGKRLAAEVRDRRVEMLHAVQLAPFAVAALAKPRIWPMPRLILTAYGPTAPDAVSGPRRAINRLLLDNLADAVTATSESGRRALCRAHGFRGSRIRVIRPGVDVERFGPAEGQAAVKAAVGLDPDRRYVAHAARLHPSEDQATLLRGFAAAAANHPDADLLIAGGGPLRDELELLAGRLGLRQRVRFLGDQEDGSAVLQAADVFVSAGGEAWPSLLEALATGLPAVLPAAGSNPEIIRDGRDGLLFPPGDWRACGRAICDLLDDPGRAYFLGQSALTRVRERHRLSDTAAAYGAIYRRLAGR